MRFVLALLALTAQASTITLFTEVRASVSGCNETVTGQEIASVSPRACLAGSYPAPYGAIATADGSSSGAQLAVSIVTGGSATARVTYENTLLIAGEGTGVYEYDVAYHASRQVPESSAFFSVNGQHGPSSSAGQGETAACFTGWPFCGGTVHFAVPFTYGEAFALRIVMELTAISGSLDGQRATATASIHLPEITSGTAAQTPEPGTWLLALPCLALLAFRRNRPRSSVSNRRSA